MIKKFEIDIQTKVNEIKDKFKTILPNNNPLSNVVMHNGNPSCDHVTVYSKKLLDMFRIKKGTKALTMPRSSNGENVQNINTTKDLVFKEVYHGIDDWDINVKGVLREGLERLFGNSYFTGFEWEIFEKDGWVLIVNSKDVKSFEDEMSKILGHEIAQEITNAINHNVSGKHIVFTGTLQSMTREKAGRKVTQLGGLVKSSVSYNTDYLVVGDDPGTKLEKAQRLGIPILTEKEFLVLIS